MADLLKLATCPYNPAHRMDARRLSLHIIKCRKHNKHLSMETCPFNATHIVPTHQFKAHIMECPDNEVVLKNLVNREESDTASSCSEDSDEEEAFEAMQPPLSSCLADIPQVVGENWCMENVATSTIKKEGYDLKAASILKHSVRPVPSGLGKAARNQWAIMEKKRVKELQEGLPFSPEVRAAFNIPEHINGDVSDFELPQSSVTNAHGYRDSDQPLRRPRLASLPQQQALEQQTQLQQLLMEQLQRQREQEKRQEEQQQQIQQQQIQQQQMQQQTKKQQKQDVPPKLKTKEELQQKQKKRQEEETRQNIKKEQVKTDQQQVLHLDENYHRQQEQNQARLQKQLEEVIGNYKNLQSENEKLRELVRQMERHMKLNKEKVVIKKDVTGEFLREFKNFSDSTNSLSDADINVSLKGICPAIPLTDVNRRVHSSNDSLEGLLNDSLSPKSSTASINGRCSPGSRHSSAERVGGVSHALNQCSFSGNIASGRGSILNRTACSSLTPGAANTNRLSVASRFLGSSGVGMIKGVGRGVAPASWSSVLISGGRGLSKQNVLNK